MEKQITEVLAQLQIALKESFDADVCETEAKKRKIAAHYQLLKAKEELHALTCNL